MSNRTPAETKTLVLGLGNPILTDDGVGVYAAATVREALPPDAAIDVSEVSVGGLGLMERMLGYDRVILIDAFQHGGGQPGDVYRMTLDELRSASPTQHSASAHDTNLVTALDMAQRMGLSPPRETIVYAVEVENVMDFGDEMTPAVAAAIPEVAASVLTELGHDPVCLNISATPGPLTWGETGGKYDFT